MRKLLLENLGLKIASILLAIILWIVASSRGQSEMYMDVPLEFRSVPPGLELVSSSVKVVSLDIKGPDRFIKNIKPSDISAAIDLGKAKKGESIFYVTRDNIQLPRAITILNISPSSVKVITEETVTKTVRVLPVIIGDPEKGYGVKSVDVVPKKIEIQGIQSEIRKESRIKTDPFDITGFHETVTQELKLDTAGKNIRTKPDTVRVTVEIGEKKQ